MGLLSVLTWPIQLVLRSWLGQLAVDLLEKTVPGAADGLKAVMGVSETGQGKEAEKSDKPEKMPVQRVAARSDEGYIIRAFYLLLSFWTWPIQLVLQTRPGQLAVFLMEKTAQVAGDVLGALVGETVGISEVKSGKENQGKETEKPDKKTTVKIVATTRDKGFLLRSAQIAVNILRWLQDWLRSLQGKPPVSSSAIKPAAMDEGNGGGVADEKVSLVAWVCGGALFVLNPLNDIVLAVRLIEYTKGVLHIYRDKSMSEFLRIGWKASPSPSSKRTEGDAPAQASLSKSAAPTTPVTPDLVSTKTAASTTRLSPTTQANSPVKIAPYRPSGPSKPRSVVTPGPTARSMGPAGQSSGPAARITGPIAPQEVSTETAKNTKDSSELDKTKGSGKTLIIEVVSETTQEERSVVALPAAAQGTTKPSRGSPPQTSTKPAARTTQVSPAVQDILKPADERTNTVVLSATMAATSPKPNQRVVSSQGVSKILSKAKAAGNDDVKVPAKISVDEPDKRGVKTEPEGNKMKTIDPECRKGQTESGESKQNEGGKTTKETITAPRNTEPSPSGAEVKPATSHGPDKAVGSPHQASKRGKRSRKGQTESEESKQSGGGTTTKEVITARNTEPPPSGTEVKPATSNGPDKAVSPTGQLSQGPSSLLVYKTTSLPSKIQLVQSTGKTSGPPTSPLKSPSAAATEKVLGGPGLLAGMPTKPPSDNIMESATQSPAQTTGPSADQGGSPMPSTKTTASISSVTTSVKTSTGPVPQAAVGTPTESMENISSDGSSMMSSGGSDDPGKKSEKQKENKQKSWKKWKSSKK